MRSRTLLPNTILERALAVGDVDGPHHGKGGSLPADALQRCGIARLVSDARGHHAGLETLEDGERVRLDQCAEAPTMLTHRKIDGVLLHAARAGGLQKGADARARTGIYAAPRARFAHPCVQGVHGRAALLYQAALDQLDPAARAREPE